jgi:hypothetical protein
MGPIGCPETSVSDHQYLLRNSPEERSSHLHRDGSLESRRNTAYLNLFVLLIPVFPLFHNPFASLIASPIKHKLQYVFFLSHSAHFKFLSSSFLAFIISFKISRPPPPPSPSSVRCFYYFLVTTRPTAFSNPFSNLHKQFDMVKFMQVIP